MAKWIKVKHASEMREGLAVEVRPCGFCGRTERLILVRQVATELPMSINGDGDAIPSGGAWRTAPGLCLHPRRPFDPSVAIRDGRLYRLAGDALAVGERVRETVAVDNSAPTKQSGGNQ